MPFAATWMDLEIISLSEVSQTERQISYDITHMWNLKYDTNEPETDSQTQRSNSWLPKGRRQEGGKDWEFGISRCKLLYREWIKTRSYCIA